MEILKKQIEEEIYHAKKCRDLVSTAELKQYYQGSLTALNLVSIMLDTAICRQDIAKTTEEFKRTWKDIKDTVEETKNGL